MSKGSDTRFKQGQSGNPKGRPRGSGRKVTVQEERISAFDVVFDQTIPVAQNGQERELSAEEAIQLRLYKDALGGSKMAQRSVLRMVLKREEWLAQHALVTKPCVVQIVNEEEPQNANAALVLLGIATPDKAEARYGADVAYERHLLEPWAVAAARKRGRKFNIKDSDHALIEASIRQDARK